MLDDQMISAVRGVVRATRNDPRASEAVDELARQLDARRRDGAWATRVAIERSAA